MTSSENMDFEKFFVIVGEDFLVASLTGGEEKENLAEGSKIFQPTAHRGRYYTSQLLCIA